MPIVRYSGGIINWMKEELENIDKKTRKIMTINKALHPRACITRLYISRELRGRGMKKCRGLHQ